MDFEKTEPPERININGIEKKLSAILDSFVGNWRIKGENRSVYRRAWEMFLPVEYFDKEVGKEQVFRQDWSMAYVPRVTIRKSLAGEDDSYFVIVLHGARDERPQQKPKEGEDVLQKNVIDRGMVMSEVEDFLLCPNGYPYHHYASLLISRDKRRQEHVTPDDISTWIKFAFLTDQYVFFNSLGAGASRPERFHAQVVDPEALRYEGETVTHPIINARRNQVGPGVFSLEDYPVDALAFVGKDASYHASRVVQNLEGMGLPYNIAVHDREVVVVGRNSERERSDCIGKKLGGYESSGVVLVGNVEEPLLGDLGLNKVVHGSEVFNELDYKTIWDNINAASLPRGWLKDLL
jgi:hypothetical protein